MTEHAVEPKGLAARRRALWPGMLVVADVGALVAAVLASYVGGRLADVPLLGVGWSIVFIASALAAFAVRRLYGRRRLDALGDAPTILAQVAVAAMVVVVVRGVVEGTFYAADVVRTAAFAAVYACVGRASLYAIERQLRRRGAGLRPTLIVGAGRVGQLVARRLLGAPELGLRPIGFLDKEPLDSARRTGLPVLGASWDLEAVARAHGVEQVIVTFSTAPDEVMARLLGQCAELGLGTAVVPRLYERTNGQVDVEHVGGLPLMTIRPANPATDSYFVVKDALDRVLAGIALAVVMPVFAAAAVAVRLSLGRPIFFRQLRVGRDGRVFELLKFRTMKDDPESAPVELPAGVAPGGVEGTDRRTRVGKVLRQTSLDELPQLFNVLFGEMSLVGPRPERPDYVDVFTANVHRYGERHRVKSGITGWAQVNGLRGKTSIAERAELDNYYIENCSPWLDLKILLLTPRAVLASMRVVE